MTSCWDSHLYIARKPELKNSRTPWCDEDITYDDAALAHISLIDAWVGMVLDYVNLFIFFMFDRTSLQLIIIYQKDRYMPNAQISMQNIPSTPLVTVVKQF